MLHAISSGMYMWVFFSSFSLLSLCCILIICFFCSCHHEHHWKRCTFHTLYGSIYAKNCRQHKHTNSQVFCSLFPILVVCFRYSHVKPSTDILSKSHCILSVYISHISCKYALNMICAWARASSAKVLLKIEIERWKKSGKILATRSMWHRQIRRENRKRNHPIVMGEHKEQKETIEIFQYKALNMPQKVFPTPFLFSLLRYSMDITYYITQIGYKWYLLPLHFRIQRILIGFTKIIFGSCFLF